MLVCMLMLLKNLYHELKSDFQTCRIIPKNILYCRFKNLNTASENRRRNDLYILGKLKFDSIDQLGINMERG